jgi:hypothetical protein
MTDAPPTTPKCPRRSELERDASAFLDVDRMRGTRARVRDGLIGATGTPPPPSARRAERSSSPDDTYDLVRRVTAAEEVLRQWAQAFTAAAAECVAIAEEEALTANGGLPGYEEAPAGSLFVPDGVGQRIAVRPDWKPGESTWDVATLVGWLIDDEVAEVKAEQRQEARRRYESRQAAADPNGEGIEPEPLDPIARAAEAAWYEVDARMIAGNVVARLLSLGRFTPAASKIEALRKKLAEQQRDTDAAVLRQVRTVGPRKYAGVKVTREDA